jgi:hypothetical protein
MKMQLFLSKARKKDSKYQTNIQNSRIMITVEEAKRKAGPDAIRVTYTNVGSK